MRWRSSWRETAAKIVELTSKARCLSLGYGLGPAFVHDAVASLDQPMPSRRFFLELGPGHTLLADEVGPFRRRKTGHIHVAYDPRVAGHELQVAIGEDMDSITSSLCEHQQWDEPTTGLVALSAGGPELAPFTQQLRSRELLLASLRFTAEHIDLPDPES